MAQHVTKVITDSWQELTNGNATDITFQNYGPEPVMIAVTTSAVAPANLDNTLVYDKGFGEINRSLAELAPGISGVRLFAFSAGTQSRVHVSQA